ncbi:hypothetical protein BDZ45DRAFT_740309 [Acephala macrosclerotiorum]|nr:hypothetical protein BDZ45DRAFT_740309 [Acephala macrosclerotiorum]
MAVSKTDDSVRECTALINFRNLRHFQLTAAGLQPLPLISALLQSRSAVPTDPRDKVFALLNPQPMTVDYTYPCPVTSNLSRSVHEYDLSGIATTSRLEILPLGFSNRRDSDLKLSSWATNWFNIGEETFRGATYFLKSDDNYGPRFKTPSSHRFPGVKPTMDSFRWLLKSFTSGFIAPPCWQSDGGAIAYDPNMIFEKIKNLSLDELGKAAASFRSIQGLRQGESEFAKALIGNVVGDLCKALEDNMRFMTAGKGRVGWLHPRGRQGDEICIFKGYPVPTILRARHEGGFVLVGDVYVQGTMKGKFFKDGSDCIDGLEWGALAIH